MHKPKKATEICKISEGNRHEPLRYSVESFIGMLNFYLQALQLHRNSTPFVKKGLVHIAKKRLSVFREQ